MPFAFKGKVTLQDMRFHHGEADDSLLSVELMLLALNVPASAIAGPLGAEDGDAVLASFFRPEKQDADRNAVFAGIKHIQLHTKYEDKHTITFAGLRPRRVHKITNIKVTPRTHGRCDVAFHARVQTPPRGYVETLAEMIKRDLKCELEHDAELELKGGEATAPAATASDLAKAKNKVDKSRLAAKKALGKVPKKAKKGDGGKAKPAAKAATAKPSGKAKKKSGKKKPATAETAGGAPAPGATETPAVQPPSSETMQ